MAATNENIKAAKRPMLALVFGSIIFLCLVTYRTVLGTLSIVLPLVVVSSLAEALMALIGATSANFVSSPYHMRRIKIMAGRVFDADKYQIAFVPTAYEPRHLPWFLAWKDVKWVFSEWGRIVWYFLYSPFV